MATQQQRQQMQLQQQQLKVPLLRAASVRHMATTPKDSDDDFKPKRKEVPEDADDVQAMIKQQVGQRALFHYDVAAWASMPAYMAPAARSIALEGFRRVV